MKNAFMIAATGSGCGKTTITCALIQAYLDRGKTVRAFKCGPDYIDPMFHSKVLNVPSKNLDPYFTTPEETERLFLADNDAEISIVEGVMGLYDGISPSSDRASSYELACVLDIPIVLVVNAKGMGRSILAMIRGYLSMDTQKRIKAVILNQISPMYFETIRSVIEEELSVVVLGYFPRQESGIESRYLGLQLPEEIRDIRERLKKAGDCISRTADLDKLLAISECSEERKVPESETSASQKVRIAVARDAAFCFYYEDNLRLLRENGAEPVFFSPLDDEKLPEDIQGLLLGGGYPELYAEQLQNNETIRKDIRNAIRLGLPSLAECGGFMYLHDTIRADNRDYEMCGVIPGGCRNTGKLVRFGYTELREKEPRFLPEGSKPVKAHEFHYYDSDHNGTDAVCVKPVSGRSWEAAEIGENHWWGFAHLYYPSNPEFVRCFVQKCIGYKGI